MGPARLLVMGTVVCAVVAAIAPPSPAKDIPATLVDVPYGPHPKQVLDFWKAPTATAAQPAPVLFYIHGGPVGRRMHEPVAGLP